MIKKEQLEKMSQIADELFGKEFQEPMETIHNAKIINNTNRTIGIVIDDDNEILRKNTKKIKPIGVSCSHDWGYKRRSDDKINYDFGDGLTIASNFYEPSREIMVKNHEIEENDPNYVIPDKNANYIMIKGKNVDIMISGLNYDDTEVGYATLEEYNQLKKKTKKQLVREIETDPNNHPFVTEKDPKEIILCNRMFGIKKKRVDRS